MVLELDEKERETLKYALEIYEEELKTERVKTDKRDWKVSIHDEEEAIKRILEKVSMS